MFKPILLLLIQLILLTSAEPPGMPQVAALFGPRNNFICNAVVLTRRRLLTTADCLIFLKNGTQRLGEPEDFYVVLNTSDIELYSRKSTRGKPSGHRIVEKFRNRDGEKYDNKYANEVLSNKWNEGELDYMLKGLSAYDFEENRYSKVVNVTRLMVHPEFAGKFEDDLAILEVADSEVFQEMSLPVKLNSDLGYNRIVQVYGWGDIARGSSRNMSYRIKTIEMYLLPPARCAQQVGSFFLPSQHLCLRPKGNETICMGFAGAPIVLDGTLLGIVEFGNPRCLHDSTVVGVRLRPFANFLGLGDILSKIISIVKQVFNFFITKFPNQ